MQTSAIKWREKLFWLGPCAILHLCGGDLTLTINYLSSLVWNILQTFPDNFHWIGAREVELQEKAFWLIYWRSSFWLIGTAGALVSTPSTSPLHPVFCSEAKRQLSHIIIVLLQPYSNICQHCVSIASSIDVPWRSIHITIHMYCVNTVY